MKTFLSIFSLLILISCKPEPKQLPTDSIAEEYVKLVLEIGQYDGNFVDAYYGPEAWRPKEEKLNQFPLENFVQRAEELISKCETILASNASNLEINRINMLKKQLIAVRTKSEMLGGKVYSFDEEAKLLYDVELPHFPMSHFDTIKRELDSLLPGEGDITIRYQNFLREFEIPKEKLDTIFRLAITKARDVTKKHVDLPENENFVLEYVTNKPWGGYNYYQGNAQSLIQINTDLPTYIDRAIDLGSHEGYPGHHVYMALTEQNLVNNKGWVEYSIYPLFSPISLIAEGSANYGIHVAFPGNEKIKFEKEFLFPLAGIDPEKADLFIEVQDLVGKLNYARNEIAGDFLNGAISREEAIQEIEEYLLSSREKAEKSLSFIETYRSYIINYNLGKDLVAKHIALNGGTKNQPEKRWEVFIEMLSNPYSASTLTSK